MLLALTVLPVVAKQTQTKEEPQTALTMEQEQQFAYYWYAARQAIQEERYSDAYFLLEFCYAINPNDGTTNCMLGIINDGLNNADKALELYREAFRADPYDNWSKYNEKLQESGRAFALYEAILVLEKAHDVQVKATKQKGKKGHAEENLLDEMLLTYARLGKWNKALAIQDELDELKGFDATSATVRYKIYRQWGKPKKAIEAVDRYLEQEPTDVRFLKIRLDLMEEAGMKAKEFYPIFDRILEIEPHNITVLNNYAYYLATHNGDLDEAERMSAITVREEPNEPTYLDTYGWILHLQGKDDLALFYLNRALWNAPDSATREVIEEHIKKVKTKK